MSPYECTVEVSQLNASIRTKAVYYTEISPFKCTVEVSMIRELKTSGLTGH